MIKSLIIYKNKSFSNIFSFLFKKKKDYVNFFFVKYIL